MAARVEHGEDLGEVLPPSASGGPHGVGDPNDQSLRKVEHEIMIPLKMKEKAKVLKCPDEVKGFGECAKGQGLMMPFRCRKEAASLKLCLESAYHDATFVDLCTREYLEERTEYRRTGIKRKDKKMES
ncbi:hypothetical protein BsWGS_14392 [Bradybaena similaris]